MNTDKHTGALILGAKSLVEKHNYRVSTPLLYVTLDGIINNSDLESDCSKGCSFCCHVEVELTRIEVKFIAMKIRQLFTKGQMSDLRISLGLRKANLNRPRPERINHREPCMFLDKGKCMIYDFRPLHCRAAHSRDSVECEKAVSDPQHLIPAVLSYKDVCADLHTGIVLATGRGDMKFLSDGLIKEFKV